MALRSRKDWRLADAKKLLVLVAGQGAHEHLLALLLGSLLRANDRDVTFLHVMPMRAREDEVRRRRRELARMAEDKVRRRCEVEVVQSDDPLAKIVERAEQYDLLLLGIQRHGRHKKLFGEFTRQVAQRTSCPIIIMSSRG